MTTHIVPASDDDLAAILALLRDRDLPTAGVADQFPRAYVTAVQEGAVVGCAGLEKYGGVGLLRSVAVRPDRQKEGIGRALVAERPEAAKAMCLDAVYLLTTTAADYFPRLGFAPCDRQGALAPLAASPGARERVSQRRRECLCFAPLTISCVLRREPPSSRVEVQR